MVSPCRCSCTAYNQAAVAAHLVISVSNRAPDDDTLCAQYAAKRGAQHCKQAACVRALWNASKDKLAHSCQAVNGSFWVRLVMIPRSNQACCTPWVSQAVCGPASDTIGLAVLIHIQCAERLTELSRLHTGVASMGTDGRRTTQCYSCSCTAMLSSCSPNTCHLLQRLF